MTTPQPENNYLQSVIDLQKMGLESTLNFVSLVQKAAESSIQQAMSQIPWIPKEGKLMVETWIGALTTGRTAVEKLLRESLNQTDFSGAARAKKS
jgi:hypothetical protein